jgi:plasmid stabilization system protein ParE
MAARARLLIHPAFYRRVRHYRDRIGVQGARPQTAFGFVRAVGDSVPRLLENPGLGHPARFEARDLADILRVSVPGFAVFALFYRWDGRTLTIVTLEHTAQNLPARLAVLLSVA